jgi:hypothetical protein
VFLSHAHTEAETVELMAVKLEDEYGQKVWLDRWILIPGEHWQQEMARGVSAGGKIGHGLPDEWAVYGGVKVVHRRD